MIIVSQNKRAIVNFNNIDQIIILGYPTHDCEIVYYGASDRDGLSHSILGKYSFERAKEVLSEIATAQSNFEYFKNATKEGKDYIINLLKYKYEKFDIYEMPKE